jgi:chemotaxis protein MotA
MDLGTLIGLGLALFGIGVGMLLEGGSLLQIVQPTAALIVFGGTIGATMVKYPLPVFLAAVKKLKYVFFDKKHDPEQLIAQLVGLAEKARRDGLLALEGELSTIKNAFFRGALVMAVDGVEPKAARQILELKLAYMEEHKEHTPEVYEAAGGFAPTIGILGAVLGLIQVMQHLDKIDEVGKGIAVAFVATIYGVGSANILFLPAAGKLKIKERYEMVLNELILEGVIGIIEGMRPRQLEEKLAAFLAHETEHGKGAGRDQDKGMKKAA